MSEISFEQIFKSDKPSRDKFLSRLFGIFNEEVVRTWCQDSRSVYRDLGRPTLRSPEERRGRTLDFTFEHRQNGRVFIAELKCELEFENYSYLKLTSSSQLKHHTSDAFVRFCDMAKDRRKYAVRVGGKSILVAGSILIWGAITPHGRMSVIRDYGFADVLSLEQMIGDLLKWGNRDYLKLIAERETWCRYLFDRLKGKAEQ